VRLLALKRSVSAPLFAPRIYFIKYIICIQHDLSGEDRGLSLYIVMAAAVYVLKQVDLYHFQTPRLVNM